MKTAKERLFEKTKQLESGCIEWTACKKETGYGIMVYQGRKHGAHRVSWLLHFGEIPKGLFVLHRCDNPACVNPNHLFLGTQRENLDDMIAKGRDRKACGEEAGRAKLTWAAVHDIRASSMRYADLARKHGVSVETVSSVRRRKTWKEPAP